MPKKSKIFEGNVRATADTFVHYLLGSKGHEAVLLSFVNAVRENAGRPTFRRVWTKNPFNPRKFLQDKFTILDIKAEGESGDLILIEIQLAEHRAFLNRALYYWAGQYGSQLKDNDSYASLRAVIGIIFVEFTLFKELHRLHNTFAITARDDPHFHFSDHFEIHSLELVKEKLDQIPGLNRPLRMWMQLFLFAGRIQGEEILPMFEGDEIMEAVYRFYEQFNSNEELRILSKQREKQMRDFRSIIDDVREEAKEMARTEGRTIGLAEGKLEGEANAVIALLEMKFKKVPATLVREIRKYNDETALQSLLASAFHCNSLEEFRKEMK